MPVESPGAAPGTTIAGETYLHKNTGKALFWICQKSLAFPDLLFQQVPERKRSCGVHTVNGIPITLSDY